MKIGIVIPTYNESENLPKLLSAIFTLPLDLSVLIVDDDSPDGTGRLADELTRTYRKLAVLHRSGKLGLASACSQGFRYFLDKKMEAIGQMDGDFSHDPSMLVTMSERLETCDMVLGSRYVKEGRVDVHWSFWRRRLSASGNFYANTILGTSIQDVTSGYRLWRSETLRDMPLDRIRSNGYVFQIEMAYLAHCLKYKINEIPIHFAERQNGRSKMSLQILVEAVLRVWQMALIYRDIHTTNQVLKINEIN
jgi:dolichol-phosphate mannosyltransferase